MANVVAYPDLDFKKFTCLDPIVDANDFPNKLEKEIALSLGTRPAGPGYDQDAHDNRRRAFFGSITRGTAAQ